MTGPGRRRAALATLGGTGASTAITVAQAFLLIPLALNSMGTALWGAWIAAAELLVVVQSFDAGIPNLLTQRVGAALGHRDIAAASRWTWTCFVMVAVLAVFLGAAAALGAPAIARWAQVAPPEADTFVAAFRIGVLGSILLMTYNVLLAAARGTQMTGIVNLGQVLGAVAGLGTAIGFLLAGFGVWALAIGLLVRGVVSLGSGAVFAYRAITERVLLVTTPSAGIVREVVRMAPPLAGASAGYLLANHSEVVLVTTIFGPTAAAVYGLTRRAADGIRNLLDAVAWAVYGAFAHLVTADDRHRARAVAADILWSRFGLASVAAGVLVAINEPFVALLFGPEHFGGVWLTAGFALQMIAGGQAFLANYLYRAAGGVRDGAWLLLAEAVARAAAMTLGLMVGGVVGAPFAAATVSVAALYVSQRRLAVIVPGELTSSPGLAVIYRVAPFLIFVAGVLLAAVGIPASWVAVGVVTASLGLVGLIALWRSFPEGSYGRTFSPWKRARI